MDLFRWPRYLDGRDAYLRSRSRRGGGLREQVGVDGSGDRHRIVESSELSPNCLETGHMAPILFHGLSQLSLPVVCVESRQAY